MDDGAHSLAACNSCSPDSRTMALHRPRRRGTPYRSTQHVVRQRRLSCVDPFGAANQTTTTRDLTRWHRKRWVERVATRCGPARWRIASSQHVRPGRVGWGFGMPACLLLAWLAAMYVMRSS
ncbi:uncharacterized protein PFL1_02144 [Pseudozyma flocculosa PF-1]|uniref:uncharacterized protein n=1 Tax=Pseudozyma flocculosa PF-1 TaxID=1277687 RepID=UPI0004560B71|nr:uncharacterized protein PFL1_02144 [Pseudozyma flocculosa PF-1]EPQ30620.1 hypothetical protein PFL1_02144 [Pseudozyma flocculosa PF-1]